MTTAKVKLLDDISSSFVVADGVDQDGQPKTKTEVVNGKAGDTVEIDGNHAAKLIRVGQAEAVG